MPAPVRLAGLVVSLFLLAACGNSPTASAKPPGNEGGGGGTGGAGGGGGTGGDGGTGGIPVTCGDGDVDDGELCDDGEGNSDTAPDACRTDCTPARCGDGVEDTGEACDQGELNSDVAPDACRTACEVPACGDGVRDTPEGCDDGEGNSDTEPDACRLDCIPAGCNDGVQDDGEECDLGPENSDSARDGCRTSCRWGYCGDGVQDTGESCDDGPRNGNEPDACRRTCVRAHCGDGVHDSAEACDDGPENSDAVPDACRTSCARPRCGDGVADTGEACDAGAANSDTLPDACRTACVLAGCGDGVVDAGEACDAGAANSDTAPDACRTSCALAGCGDGVVDAGEACDAGAANSDATPDACRTACVLPACGDGVTDAGEACDAGAANSDTVPDACRIGCVAPACGDGVLDTGEECDDGGVLPNDGCSATCVVEPAVCGNAIREAPFEECDDGNLYDGDGCSHLCDWEVPAVCGGTLANPVIDLRVAATADGGNGFFYSRNTQFDLQAATSAVCGGAGPEVFHAYVIPVAGNLVVDVVTPAGSTLNPMAAVRRICGQSSSELGCAPQPVGLGQPGDDVRLVIRDVDPSWGPVFVHVDGWGATSGVYDLHVQVKPPLPAGAACAVDGSAGPCPTAAPACTDPDGDGTGACVPVVAGGGACDPTRAANVCASGFYCPGGAAPVCTPNCGNGVVDAGEECDDGNAVSTDNCSTACLQAGTDCAAPFDLDLGWDPVTRTSTWSDDTSSHVAHHAGSCGATSIQKDAVAAFTAPAAGTYSFTLQPTGFDGALYLWDGTCGAGSPELACVSAAGYGSPDMLLATLAQNQTVYVVVDGNGATYLEDGAFTLTVGLPVCGDGVVQPPEECDDGNTAGGDNCSPTCLEAGDACAAPWQLAWDAAAGGASWTSSTTGRGAEYSAACTVAAANDAVARFVAPAAGTYAFQVDATWNAAVFLWGAACGPTSTVLGCAGARATGMPEVVTATLAAGDAVHVVVDAAASGSGGPFTLAVRRVVCGDGQRVNPEECDDGNVVAGDGCDAACLAETLLETEPNDTRGMATPATIGRIYRGTIDPAADYDYYAFVAAAGTSYTFETFVGAINDCTATATGTSADTRIRVYDGAGTQLADDDDGGLGGVGRCSKLTWTAPAAGTYYLLVRHYSESSPVRITPYFVELRSP